MSRFKNEDNLQVIEQEYLQLIKAIQQQNIGGIQRAIWKHPQLLYQFYPRKNPLTVACEQKKTESIKFIIQKIVNFYDKNYLKCGNFIDDSLIYCIISGNLHLVTTFHQAGYSMRRVIIDQNGCKVTTLDFAILLGQQKIAEHLCLHYYGGSWKKNQDEYYQNMIDKLKQKYIIREDDYKRVKQVLFQSFGQQKQQGLFSKFKKVCKHMNFMKKIFPSKNKKDTQTQKSIQSNRKLKN